MQETIRARVDARLKKQFEAVAKSRGTSVSLLLREYMEECVSTHAVEEQHKQETLLAIESIESGRFIEGDAVFAWLDTWGADTPGKKPE